MKEVERMEHPKFGEVIEFNGKTYEIQYFAGKTWLHLVENKVRILQGSFYDREAAVNYLEKYS